MSSAIFNEIILQAHIFFPDNSLHTMYKLFLSAVEYLPFSSGDASKASFEEIIERFVDPGDICCHEIHQASYFFYHSHRYVLIFFKFNAGCFPDLDKQNPASMMRISLMLHINITCSHFKRQWLFSGFASHHHPRFQTFK